MWALFFSITLAICLTQFASEIYAPAMPAMGHDLGVGIDAIQWTISIYMWGVALCQLIYGPISEGIGRKKTILFGLLLFLGGTVLSRFAPSIQGLLWGRLIQGLGAAATAALWRSVFRDIFKGDDLAKYSAYLCSIVVFIVPAAPVLGGYLSTYFGWRSCFTFMIFYALLALLIILLSFQETSQHHHREKLKIRFAVSQYKTLLSSPQFMIPAAACCLTYGAFFAWFVTGPILLIKQIGISPVFFGWLTFFSSGITYFLASILNGRKIKSWGSSKMLALGWGLMIVSSVVILLSQLIFGLTFWGLALPVIFFFFGSALIWPNVFASAFTPFGHIAGYAGALYGFMQLGGGALFSALMSYLPDLNAYPVSIVMIVSAALAWILYTQNHSKAQGLDR